MINQQGQFNVLNLGEKINIISLPTNEGNRLLIEFKYKILCNVLNFGEKVEIIFSLTQLGIIQEFLYEIVMFF